MQKKFFHFSIFPVLFFVPLFAFAAENVYELIDILIRIIGLLARIAMIAAIFAFSWGLAVFIWNTSDSKKIDEGKRWMFWAVIAMFVLITLWGIITLFMESIFSDQIIIPRKGIPI